MINKIQKFKKFIIGLLLAIVSFIGITKLLAYGTYNTGYLVPTSRTNYAVQHFQIPETYARCGYVDNYSGSTIFIGTKTTAEWNSFKNNSPSSTAGCDGGSTNNAGVGYGSATICGSWDLNCDQAIGKSYNHVSTDCTCGTWDTSCDSGWQDSVPSCGVSGDYCGTCGDVIAYSCSSWDRTQQCR